MTVEKNKCVLCVSLIIASLCAAVLIFSYMSYTAKRITENSNMRIIAFLCVKSIEEKFDAGKKLEIDLAKVSKDFYGRDLTLLDVWGSPYKIELQIHDLVVFVKVSTIPPAFLGIFDKNAIIFATWTVDLKQPPERKP